MAARDRFSAYLEPPAQSTLQRYIHNACDPQNYEPNLALNLEVVDLINTKRGNAPREAAMTIVQLINSRNANVAMLALALLDICVKNCGYPFHLQISTKEFLNELVRRFPERPPIRPSRAQQRILESIEEWRQTICQTSRYKDDLGFIRDMHRLLLYKGYMFPEIRREDAAVLNPSDNLQSAEEMEEEEKIAQSAKLQELIRRGNPDDLREANRLMKIMAGYDTRHRTDYRAKAAEEVSRVQEKAKLLEEMLENFKPGDKLAEGDVYEELASALQNAHPKIQKMCEDESDDNEAVSKLLEINDSIHRTVQRYKLIKAGDVAGASNIPKGTLGTSTGVKKNAANELSLIDFGGEEEQLSAPSNGNTAAKAPAASTLEGDLLGLSFQDEPQGSVALPLGPSDEGPGSASIPKPSPAPSTSTPTPLPADPFAAITSGGSRTSSPFNKLQSSASSNAASSSLLDLSQLTSGASASNLRGSYSPQQPTQGKQMTPAQAAEPDDEWTFSSALPEETLPSQNTIEVLNTAIGIKMQVKRFPGENKIHGLVSFSNNTPHAISELHFQIAIEKAYSLQLRPQSGRDIAPYQKIGVQQQLQMDGVQPGKGNSVRLRYKVSFKVGQELNESDGLVPSLGIS
ncbi:ADP-ribosylation factor-binding protein GGA2 [Nannizzia gypsea CBS 118893]|uniref:ADP-ribosylation factor-binding protein GGA2 n=1 Tax=Arthroderma gypseum (strain ATCC MYA-4604 / CBS 118893) TaxID=535722 RepID=E5R186_ARTGP|nr:ADP-ribosylation factor-binding protein GGA2 [Nannizzia gypsea CBS 118893]EFQ98475.1 ADP-ribosylation factor-binding protein GGA2 [Nannizzia gypsea CBS 118893]